MRTSKEIDAQSMEAFKASGATVEDLARAWASIDGKLDAFHAGRDGSLLEDEAGHYAGYCVEAREIIERATKYAMARKTETTT